MSNTLLNRIFTKNTFESLLEENDNNAYYAVIRRYIDNPTNKQNKEIINEIYQKLKSNYKNEYYYKNTLLNKLLFGVHNPLSTVALTEIPIAKSKADFILINGKAVVYEIKTELDNFDRLEGQIKDYYKAFTNVCVVTCESHYENIKKRLENTTVGIYVLTKEDRISTRKKPVENYSNLDPEVMFKILRKAEFESIIKNHYGFLPEVSPFVYYGACKKHFKMIEIEKAYSLFMKALKSRNPVNVELVAKVPNEIKSVIYFSKFNKKKIEKINEFLEIEYGG